MDKITKKEVIAGDIILYHGDSLLAKLIQFFDGTEMNHASIYLGEGVVGEALGGGLTRRTIDDSIKDDDYVVVRRLKTDPGTMQPVVNKAADYLSIGNRYGFEQILLLAFLGLTRKLHVNRYLEWLLRKIFDRAAEWLMDHGNKQPMICSEFAYRCYDEALPVAHDPYFLDIEPFPKTSQSDIPGVNSFSVAVIKKNIHRDSLLAWTEDVVTNRSRSGSNVLLRSFEKGAAKQLKKKLSADEKKLAVMPFDALVKNYLEEAKKPPMRSLSLEASLRSPEMLGNIKKFSEALYETTKAQTPKVLKSKSPDRGETQVPEALDNLFKTAADFVTPGDLYGCRDLYTIGSMTSK
jgi:hypothetical protein